VVQYCINDHYPGTPRLVNGSILLAPIMCDTPVQVFPPTFCLGGEALRWWEEVPTHVEFGSCKNVNLVHVDELG